MTGKVSRPSSIWAFWPAPIGNWERISTQFLRRAAAREEQQHARVQQVEGLAHRISESAERSSSSDSSPGQEPKKAATPEVSSCGRSCATGAVSTNGMGALP